MKDADELEAMGDGSEIRKGTCYFPFCDYCPTSTCEEHPSKDEQAECMTLLDNPTCGLVCKLCGGIVHPDDIHVCGTTGEQLQHGISDEEFHALNKPKDPLSRTERLRFKADNLSPQARFSVGSQLIGDIMWACDIIDRQAEEITQYTRTNVELLTERDGLAEQIKGKDEEKRKLKVVASYAHHMFVPRCKAYSALACTCGLTEAEQALKGE